MPGNCARIRRAFVLGARTLRSILHANEADVSTELYQFFKNCNLRYHGSYQRPDVAGPRSWQGRLPNGVHKFGGARRSDIANAERNEDVAQNGDHPRLYNHLLPVDHKEPTVGETSSPEVLEYAGARILFPSAVELASGREENSNESAGNLKPVPGEETALNFGETKVAFNGSNGLRSHSRRIDEEPMIRGDKTMSNRIPSQICALQIVCDQLPARSGASEEDELSPGMFSERSSSGHKTREGLERRDIGSAGVSKQGTTSNGNHVTQHSTNGSTSSCSKNDSEEEEESSSQTSSKGEVTASENATKGGLLPLSCRPGNF